MVRGTKRKIPIEKITKRSSLATCFTKRISGLYSKASQLCFLSDAQIAILATPSSSQSNVSFYSFGHSSVDSVVSAFLAGKPPVPSENKKMREDVGVCLARKDLGLGLWWDDESLHRSENPEEIKEAMESMSSLLTELRSVHEDLKKNEIRNSDVVLHNGTQSLNQTQNLQSTSVVPDDCLKTDTEMVISDSFCFTDNLPGGNLDEIDLCQLIDFGTSDEVSSFQDIFTANLPTQELNQTHNLQCNYRTPDDCLNGFVVKNTQQQDHIQTTSESSCNNNTLTMGNLDEDCGFVTTFDSFLADGVFQSNQDFHEFVSSLLMNSETSGDKTLGEDDLNGLY